MKVFISWSGETSRNIAEIIRQWLPSVIQSVRPYYSPDDITKGTRWSTEIGKELDESKVGIICLTKDNLNSSWIMFEAGALSKNIDNSKVCPILFGIDPADIQGPLVQFQAAKFNKEEIKKVVRMINSELGEVALSPEVFENVFDMWWPKLHEKVEVELNKVVKQTKAADKGLRGERDILEEILSLTRRISFTRERENEKSESISPVAIRDLVTEFIYIVKNIGNEDKADNIIHLRSLFEPINYFVTKLVNDRVLTNEYKTKLEEALIILTETSAPRIYKRVVRKKSNNSDEGITIETI